jgi:hypothetical protein
VDGYGGCLPDLADRLSPSMKGFSTKFGGTTTKFGRKGLVIGQPIFKFEFQFSGPHWVFDRCHMTTHD